MKNLGKLIAWGLMFVAAVFIQMLSSHIVLSIAELYSIELITSMSFLQVFGLLMIVDIVKYRYRSLKEEGAEFIDKLMHAINSAFNATIVYLMIWAIAFLSFAILN
jgi:iron only hydrogenase large subunit-like protein